MSGFAAVLEMAGLLFMNRKKEIGELNSCTDSACWLFVPDACVVGMSRAISFVPRRIFRACVSGSTAE